MKTYLIYPRIMVETGLGQSLYTYLYFYKLKYHLISSVDIVTIKLLLLICKDGLLISLGQTSDEQLSPVELAKTKLLLNNTLRFIKYLYAFSVSESNLVC